MDRSAPHSEALRVLYDMHEATAPGPVVYGDKENADLYKIFNDSCCLDIGERGQAPGGRDLIVEVKAWTHLHPATLGKPHRNVVRRGATHGFGSTLEHATRRVLGVKARAGARDWDHSTGTGAVDAHGGDYDDAQRRKRNHVVLFLLELSSALSPPAYRHVRWLKARSKRRDTTEYEGWAARAKASSRPFVQHWTQRLSARPSSAVMRVGPTTHCARARCASLKRL